MRLSRGKGGRKAKAQNKKKKTIVDTVPNAFAFTDLTGVALSTLTESNAITVAGINAPAPISVTGGEYQKNGGTWTNITGTVVNGDAVKVRRTSSASNSTPLTVVLTIGGVSDTFSITTVATADTTPDAFSFTPASNAALSTVVQSNLATITGINAATAISITGGEYQVNGGSWVTAAGTVVNNDQVRVRRTSSASNSTAVSTTLTVGGVSATFTITTLASGATALSPQFAGVNFSQGAAASQSFFTSDPHFTEHVEFGQPLGYLYHDAYLNTAGSGPDDYFEVALFAGLPNYNHIRVTELWERIQPTLGAALDTTRLAELTREVNAVTSRGAVASIDIHNYGARPTGSGNLIGGTGPTAAQFYDLWTRLANAFKANALVWFDIMNEPIDFPNHATEWATYATGAKNAIRATGATNKIIVPGIAFTGAHSWVSSGSAAAFAGWSDTNYAFGVHQYADSDFSGTHRGELNSEDVYPETLAIPTAWAEANGHDLYLGEFNTDRDNGNQAKGERGLANAIRYMQAHPCWIGFAVWQGGPMGQDDLYTTWSEADGSKPSRHDRTVRAVMVTGSTITVPTNTGAGTLSGTPTEGQTLSVSGSSWTHTGNADLGFEEFPQWQMNDGSWADIVGATESAIALSLPLVGKTVRRGTFAKNIGGTAATVFSPASSTIAAGTAPELFSQPDGFYPGVGWVRHSFSASNSFIAEGAIVGTPAGGNGVYGIKAGGYVVPGYVYEVAARASSPDSNMIFQVGVDDPAGTNGSTLDTHVNLTTSAFTNNTGSGPDHPTRRGTTTVTTVGSEKLIKQQLSFATAGTPTFTLAIAGESPGGTINPTLLSLKCIGLVDAGTGGTLGPELLTNTVPGGTGWTTNPFNASGSSVSSGSFSGTPDGFSGVLSLSTQGTVAAGDTYEFAMTCSSGTSNLVARWGVDAPSGGTNNNLHCYVNLTSGSLSDSAGNGSNAPQRTGVPSIATVGSDKVVKQRIIFANSGSPQLVVGIAETSPAGTLSVSAVSLKKVT